ncbi:ADP-ribose pyrophosphatase YjhB (NUDIX family) [Dyadobacter jejuensis]|uniref:ADP-ribose pyrophosphatase YjhB (NUDIX family) n=1 Tax=Dyadobacter jejuensis TaxID=1082580 RepID=A0A316AI10_9BACT|nr:NUDIX domain-containing protein [Dyadobacter jejuensis]PWJ57342.1 ADP-ribose pyrophosphatase YjhB (NUDIX family) [Dyadobacter jejuensis]
MVRYPDSLKVFVAIDCIIFGFDGKDLKLLLVKRKLEPESGNWSLMGGFLFPNEDLEEGASRILKDLTGLTNIYCEQLTVKGEKNRDPGSRTVSVVFFALIKIEESDQESVKNHNAFWIELDKRPSLIFDHNQMVLEAIDHLRYKAALHPIGFELLSETFTIPQLQKLYEAIYNVPIDRRNFSRKLLSTSLLIDTGMKNIHSTTKKATLYRLDKVRYNEKFHAFWNFMADAMK